jgi:spore coat protein U-like protein
MMQKKLALLFLFLPFTLFADCEFSLSVPSIVWEGDGFGGYEIYSSTEYVQEVSFSVSSDDDDDDDDDDDNKGKKSKKSASRDDNEDCEYFVTIATDGGKKHNRTLSGNGLDKLSFEIYNNSSKSHVIQDISDASSSSDVIEGSISLSGSNSTKQESFFIAIPAGQMVKAGTYSGTLDVKVFEGKVGDTKDDTDTQSVSFSVEVPSIVQASLVDPGGGFDEYDVMQSLDFGELVENDRQDFDIRVRSNAGYSVTWDSENNGNLAHEEGGKDDKIPYKLYANGKEKKASGKSSISSKKAVTDKSGEVHSISVKIGSFKHVKSGTYQDTISLTFTTTD